METISNLLHGVKDAVLGHQETPAEQKPAEAPVAQEESKGVLSKIGEVMKEILLPPTEDLEVSSKEPEPVKEETKPVEAPKPDQRPELRPASPEPRPVPAAESPSKKETETLSRAAPADIGSAEFRPLRPAAMTTSTQPAELKGVAKFEPAQPQIRAQFVPTKAESTSDLNKRLALAVQPACRAYLARTSWTEKLRSGATEESSITPVEASERIQGAARRWLFRHRKEGTKMTQDEAARIIQSRCRQWLDSTGFAEHKTARKKNKKNKKHGKKEKEESKLDHFGRLVREARGELPEGSATAAAAPAAPIDITDKAHLSAPAKAHIVELLQATMENIKNRDESALPKLKEADLFKTAPEPVPLAHPEPTHVKNESGAPMPYIQQPRA